MLRILLEDEGDLEVTYYLTMTDNLLIDRLPVPVIRV